MRLLLFDPINKNEDHAAFNATIVSAVSILSNVTSIYTLLDNRQLKTQFFKEISKNSKVNLYEFPGSNRFCMGSGERTKILFQNLLKYKLIFKVLDEVRPDAVVMLAADNFFAPFALARLAFEKGNQLMIFVIWHNNLENLTRGYAFIKKLMWKVITRLGNVSFIVLSPFLESIGQQMFAIANFRSLPHPTYSHLHDCLIGQNIRPTKKIDFLFVGRHARDASDSGFLKEFLACCADTLLKLPLRSVTVAFPSDLYDNTYSESGVVLLPYESYPVISEYISLIAKTKFVIIPPSNGQRLTASGVLADLLTLGIPVLAPNEGVWQWQTAPKNRELLFSSKKELRQSITRALTLSDKEYQILTSDILKYSRLFNLERTSKNLSLFFFGHR